MRRNQTDLRESIEISIEGLSSLKDLVLGISSNEINISLRNLNSVTYFDLFIPGTIDENITTKLFDQLPNIEDLSLCGKLSYFKLDSLVNIKKLTLEGTLNDNFNFELFENLRIQLQDLCFCVNKNDDEIFFKLFDGYHFPNIVKLRFLKMGCNMRRVNKKFLNKFPMLRELIIEGCKLEKIEDDTFSNLKHLARLDLSDNLLETLPVAIFSQLVNLEDLILRKNRIRWLERNVFSNLKKLRTLNLYIMNYQY